MDILPRDQTDLGQALAGRGQSEATAVGVTFSRMSWWVRLPWQLLQMKNRNGRRSRDVKRLYVLLNRYMEAKGRNIGKRPSQSPALIAHSDHCSRWNATDLLDRY